MITANETATGAKARQTASLPSPVLSSLEEGSQFEPPTNRAQTFCDRTKSPKKPQFRVGPVGIDTISFAFRPQDPELWLAMTWAAANGRLAPRMGHGWPVPMPEPGSPAEEPPSVRQGARGSFSINAHLGAARWFAFPEHKLIYCEGRGAAIASGDENNRGLAPFSELPELARPAASAFEELASPNKGVMTSEPIGVRRIDLAAEVLFEDPAHGLSFLRLLAGLTVPKMKTTVWRNEGRVETVGFVVGKEIRFRAYDKGAEAEAKGRPDASPPGTRIRLERQLRFGKPKQMTAEQFSSQDPAKLWLQEFEAWAEHAPTGDLTGTAAAQSRLLDKVEAGELNLETATRLVGALAIRELRGEDWWKRNGKAGMGRKLRHELAQLDVLIAECGNEAADTVDVAEVLTALRNAWH